MRLHPLLCVLTLAAATLAGCSSGTDEGDGGSASGSASAYVKDAPSDDFREVHVLVTEVSIHRSGGTGNATGSTTGTGTSTSTATGIGNTSVTVSASATLTASSSPTASEAGWIVLFSSAAGVDVDLLNTTGARAAFLGEADLAAGKYQQVRLKVASAYGIKHDGTRENITVSSGTLRVVHGFEVEGGMETRVTLDIDLERSLRSQGNGGWRMTPVIGKTTSEVVADDSSGEEQADAGDVESVPEAA